MLRILSSRRATYGQRYNQGSLPISIHALLAESDRGWGRRCLPAGYFYPRSPRGERLPASGGMNMGAVFLSTLSLRRATQSEDDFNAKLAISIHALLAESDAGPGLLLLALFYFYPRSPCGERLDDVAGGGGIHLISIHALLAESDVCPFPNVCPSVGISIHALLAESDPSAKEATRRQANFYPRSPCGERLFLGAINSNPSIISIHALLAESDLHRPPACCGAMLFLSTLSLRRATVKCHKKQFLFCS